MTTPSEGITIPLWLAVGLVVVFLCACWSRFMGPPSRDWDFTTGQIMLFGWAVGVLLGVIVWLLMR